MDLLTKHIADRLAVKKFCTIFENQISKVWPLVSEEIARRNEAIHAFARERGWSAKISDPGIRVTFRKLDPSEQEAGAPPRKKA